MHRTSSLSCARSGFTLKYSNVFEKKSRYADCTLSPTCQFMRTNFGRLVFGSSTLRNAYWILLGLKSSVSSSSPPSPKDDEACIPQFCDSHLKLMFKPVHTSLRTLLWPSYPNIAQSVSFFSLTWGIIIIITIIRHSYHHHSPLHCRPPWSPDHTYWDPLTSFLVSVAIILYYMFVDYHFHNPESSEIIYLCLLRWCDVQPHSSSSRVVVVTSQSSSADEYRERLSKAEPVYYTTLHLMPMFKC